MRICYDYRSQTNESPCDVTSNMQFELINDCSSMEKLFTSSTVFMFYVPIRDKGTMERLTFSAYVGTG